MDVIIAIGHDGAGDDFPHQVGQVLRTTGTVNAVITGGSWSPEWGMEDATWYAATFEDGALYAEARARILAVAAAHNQEAVAFTVGTTEVADTPTARRAREYRDFL